MPNRYHFLTALLALLCACSSSSEPLEDSGVSDTGLDGTPDTSRSDAGPIASFETHQSGTRLIARTLGGLPTSFRDSELDISCQFFMLPDGSHRCLPEETIPLAFADADCTNPIFEGSADAETILRVAETRPACGAQGFQGVQIGGVVTPEFIYRASADGCMLFPANAEAEYHSVTTVPATMFVAAEREETPVTLSLSAVRFMGEDGSIFTPTLFDSSLGINCGPLAHLTGTASCVGETGYYFYEGSASLIGYRKSDCITPLILGLECAPEDGPQVAQHWTYEAGCDAGAFEYVNLGAEVPTSNVERVANMCPGESEPSPGLRFFEVGEPVSQPAPQLASSQIPSGSVEAIWWGPNLETPLVGLFAYFAPDLDMVCSEREVNGTTRCFPLSTSQARTERGFFADAGCTEPVARASACATPKIIFERRSGDDGELQYSFFEVGDPVAGTMYQGTPSDCDPSEERPELNYYRIGAALPDDVLPELELREI